MLLVILCEAEANTSVNNCVSDYEEFEEKTFSNKGNRYKLYDVFYPSNDYEELRKRLPFGLQQLLGQPVHNIHIGSNTVYFENVIKLMTS